jgi:hypothetical protein
MCLHRLGSCRQAHGRVPAVPRSARAGAARLLATCHASRRPEEKTLQQPAAALRLPGAIHSSLSPGAMAGAEGREHPPATWARVAHSPAVKDQSTYNPLRPGRSLGAPSPHRERLTTPALPGASVPVLHAQCLLPTSTDW